MHVEFLVEEPSAQAALEVLLPRLLPAGCAFRVRPFEGWQDLPGDLRTLLRGYHRRILREGETDLRVVILLDGDGICARRKASVEEKVAEAGLLTRRTAGPGQPFHVLTPIAVQELEAWWLGDRAAIMAAYPNVKAQHFKGVARDPDSLPKPNETLWAVLKQGRYFAAGKRKSQWAAAISRHLDPARNDSASFRYFCEGLAALR